MKTSVNYVIVADTETGGLPCKASKGKPAKLAFNDIALCEVAFVVVDTIGLQIVDEYNAILAPYKEDLIYDPGAERVHGLTVNHLTQNGEEIQTVYENIKSILTKYSNGKRAGGAILCGHNFQNFDIPFLENMFAFCGDNLSDYYTFVEDTMKMGWYSAIEQENYKLGTCCKIEGVELVDSHRALTDTKANARLFIKYLEKLRGKGVPMEADKGVIKTRFREKFQLV